MKKHSSRQKINDDVIVTRVKNYLAENVDKTFVDVSQMARTLKERYREYNNRSDNAFCQMVESAYKVVLRSYGLEGASTTEGSEEESDLEMLDEGGSSLNDRLLALYKMKDGKKGPVLNQVPNNNEKTGEPIDIISSDEDGPNVGNNGGNIPNIPKISDQITITPHIPVKSANISSSAVPISSSAVPRVETSKAQIKPNNDKKRKMEVPKNPPPTKKKAFDVLATKIVTVNFDNIGGVSEIMSQICDLVLHMKHPEVYKQLGIKSPRGALLHGPPGTGKTLLAHAIAGKLQIPFIAISGTELVGGVSGESEERIRELFERACSVAPSILFIDEIDAVCGNRLNAQKDMEKRMVAQLLASLDYLGEIDANVLVLAATNNPDTLDPSLRRAGRLEQEITLGIPSLKARREILAILCKGLALNENVDMNALAQITPGFVGADLQALVNKASTHAIKRAFREVQSVDKKDVIVDKKNDSVIPDKEVAVVANGDKEEVTSTNVELVTAENQEANPKEDSADGENQEKPKEVPALEEEVTSVPTTSELPKVECAPIDANLEALNILENKKPYTAAQLSGLSIRQEDFVEALKTTKPCAVREGIITVPDVTWEDVGSLNQVRKDLQLAVLAPVKYPDLLKKLGLAVPSGVLLCGPPGCGKTLLAKAVANEAGVNFISVKGPELLNMYVGESERAVRTCFRRARNSAPCVIFFDEFDALCPRRVQQDNNGAARVVNQLLTEMDGIESREGVFVLAASNRPDIIDPAVLRPGRLDRVMYVGMPAIEDRSDILKKLTKGGTQPPLGKDVDLDVVAELTEGYTGADLAGLVRAAATIALTNHIAQGTLEEEIVVSFENFREALSKCKPSVSNKEQQHYEKLRLKYACGADEKDMEMETEPTIEESMDTV